MVRNPQVDERSTYLAIANFLKRLQDEERGMDVTWQYTSRPDRVLFSRLNRTSHVRVLKAVIFFFFERKWRTVVHG